jgi:hypothetical protein
MSAGSDGVKSAHPAWDRPYLAQPALRRDSAVL